MNLKAILIKIIKQTDKIYQEVSTVFNQVSKNIIYLFNNSLI